MIPSPLVVPVPVTRGPEGGDLSSTTRPDWPPADPPPPAPNCPICAEPRARRRYCENCGYDFDTGTALDHLVRTGVVVGWVAEIRPDREFFDRNDDDVVFPTVLTRRQVALAGDRTLIGRCSPRRNIHPDIDLSLAPEDRGVSRVHAFLDHTADGRLTVTDEGSANGTWVGDDPDPIVAGRTVPLADGDHIYVGSFTRITIRRRR